VQIVCRRRSLDNDRSQKHARQGGATSTEHIYSTTQAQIGDNKYSPASLTVNDEYVASQWVQSEADLQSPGPPVSHYADVAKEINGGDVAYDPSQWLTRASQLDQTPTTTINH
jgi:hypothetical protein